MITTESPIFPDGLIEETLDMLALPFPESDRKTSKAIPVLARSIGSARRGSRGSHANLQGVAKALKDSKRGDHWLDPRIAIVAISLTLFFGLVQSVEGAVQVFWVAQLGKLEKTRSGKICWRNSSEPAQWDLYISASTQGPKFWVPSQFGGSSYSTRTPLHLAAVAPQRRICVIFAKTEGTRMEFGLEI
ncbi:hypothetical protein B0T12DRAFT_397371 [Alternaria alternata]|nr:hypothetical protein B0T12DRAFT_397371 [Alternaria alternata]